MKIAIFGAGAIGGWLASLLAEAAPKETQISLIARGANLEALRRDGLRVLGDAGERRFGLRAGAAQEFGPQDIVIIALKAQQIAAAISDLRTLIAEHTTVVPAVNGIPWWFLQNFPGPLENASLDSVDQGGRLAKLIPVEQVVGCVVHASSELLAPGCIRIGASDRLLFGSLSDRQHERMRWLIEAFTQAGVRSLASENIRLEVWSKLWGNMNMGPLSALTRATTGRLLDDPNVHALCLRMMEEMAECGRQLGLVLPLSPRERMMVTRKLGDFKTSMLQDLQHGRPLEFAPLLGAVVEIAQRLQTPAPFCESVLGLVRQLSTSVSAAR